MPRETKIAVLLAALAAAVVFSSVAAGSSQVKRDEFVPISLTGTVPGWLYPGKLAVYNLRVGLTSNRVAAVALATLELNAKPPQMALLKKGSTAYVLVAGKPAWTIRNLVYHQDASGDKLVRLTFYVSTKAKPKARYCLQIIERVGESSAAAGPICVHVYPGRKPR